jgi:hypothetical protein
MEALNTHRSSPDGMLTKCNASTIETAWTGALAKKGTRSRIPSDNIEQ